MNYRRLPPPAARRRTAVVLVWQAGSCDALQTTDIRIVNTRKGPINYMTGMQHHDCVGSGEAGGGVEVDKGLLCPSSPLAASPLYYTRIQKDITFHVHRLVLGARLPIGDV